VAKVNHTITGETFTDRVKFYINAGQISSTITDYPASVQISDLPTSFVDAARSNGGDFRITTDDKVTRVALSVEQFNQGAYTGVIAFNIPSADSLTEMYISCGNGSATQPVASDTYGSENVTNGNVVARITLDEDPSGVGEVMLDTTAIDNDGEPINMEAGDSVAAGLNNGVFTDGVNEYVNFDNHATLNYDHDEDFTIGVAVKIPTGNQPDTTADSNYILAKWSSFATGYPYVLGFRNQTHATPANRFKLFFARWDLTNGPVVFSVNNGYNDGEWHHITFGKSGSTMYLKVDGEAIQSTTDTTSSSTENTADLRIANSQVQGVYSKHNTDELLIHQVWVGESHADARASNILTPTTFYTIEDETALLYGQYI
jgi:hypothetical protein